MFTTNMNYSLLIDSSSIHAQSAPNCPRCASSNTKFCYYNNYSLSQPRYFCKACRRYWTKGGSLRNVPVGGGCRKSRRARSSRPTPNFPYPRHHPAAGLQDSPAGPNIDLAAVFAKYVSQNNNNNNNETVVSCSSGSSSESLQTSEGGRYLECDKDVGGGGIHEWKQQVMIPEISAVDCRPELMSSYQDLQQQEDDELGIVWSDLDTNLIHFDFQQDSGNYLLADDEFRLSENLGLFDFSGVGYFSRPS